MQRKSYPISIFFDIDPVVETQVVVDIYSCKNGEEVRDDQAVYYEREEESSVRNRYIMDEVMKRLWKNSLTAVRRQMWKQSYRGLFMPIRTTRRRQ